MARKHMLFVTTALAALAWSGSAQAQDCSTSTSAGVTTLNCASDTVTTPTTNSDPNDPATRDQTQSFTDAIVGRVNSGVTVSGYGLRIIGTGTAPVTFENNGSIVNDSGSASSVDGLRLTGNGGLITYRGNGSLRTNSTSLGSGFSPAALFIDPRNGSAVNIGSLAASVTGTFTGPTGIYIGDNASARRADVNAYFSGGSFDTQTGISMQLVDSNINLVMTGNTIIAPNGGSTGISIDGARPNAGIPVHISVVTDAQIGTAAAPVTSRGITVFGLGAASGSVSLTGTGSIFGGSTLAVTGIQLNPGSGHARVTTAPGTSITIVGPAATGIRTSAPDVGVEAAGAISARDGISASAGIFNSVDGLTGNLSVALTGAGTIAASRMGISGEHSGIGLTSIATAAGTSINVAQGTGDTFATGVRAVSFGPAGITLDIGGSVTVQANAGTGNSAVLASAINGPIDVTIRSGAVVSATASGTSSAAALTVRRREGGTGTTEILNLGTLRGPVAADFVGTLQVGNGGTTGLLEGDVVNNGTLIFNRSDASTYAGIISGAGALRQAGSGTTTLTGASTFTGGTTVAAGTLLVNGATASGVQVDGGTLGGTGSVGSTTVASGGRLSPGSGGVGTFTINGNLALQSGSLVFIDVSPAGADRINATGTATINGGLTAFSSGGALNAGRYTILNAAGGVTGTFSPFTTQGPFPGSPSLEYDANNVVLVLSADTSFNVRQQDLLIINPAMVTAQQVNLFNTRLLGRLNGGTPIFDQSYAVAFSDPAVQAGLVQARLAITNAGAPALIVFSDPVLLSRTVTTSTASTSHFTLAGQSDTTTTETTAGGSGVTRARGDTRSCGAAIAALPASQRPACATPPAGESYSIPTGTTDVLTTVTTTYTVNEARTDITTTTTNETWEVNGTAVPVGTVHAAARSGLYDLGSRFLAHAGREGARALFGPDRDGGRGSVWAEGYGFRVSHSPRGGVPGERRDARGLAGGLSIAAGPGIELGIGVDYGRLDLDVAATGETADIDLTQFALTGRFGGGPLSIAAALTYGKGEVKSARTFIGTATGAYDVKTLGAVAEARYGLETGAWRVAPVAGLDWMRLDTDAVTESGAFGFILPAAQEDRTRAFAGLDVGRELALGSRTRLQLSASARYLAVLGGRERVLPVVFAAAPGTPLSMQGRDEQDGALLGARARLGLSRGLDLYAVYDARLASGYDAHAATVGLRLRW